MTKNGYRNPTRTPKKTKEVALTTPKKQIAAKVVSNTPGRLRLRIAHDYRKSEGMQLLGQKLEANPNINSVRTNMGHGSIVIQHDGTNDSLENVFTTLKDLGIVFVDITVENTEAAAGVSSAVVDLNKRVKQATNGALDLRILFPLGLATLSMRQLFAKGLQFEIIPWYVLAWYAFDSFLKLNGTSPPQSTND